MGCCLSFPLFIIANTIQADRVQPRAGDLYHETVGATNGFIRVPFVIEGMVLGLLSGALSYGIIYYVYQKVTEMFRFSAMFGLVSFSKIWWIMLTGFLVAGTLIGIFGSAISLSKYLKDEGGITSE